MKVLIFGAGVIGKIYAAKLFEAKEDVTLLARSKNFQKLQQEGITIHNLQTHKSTTSRVSVARQFNPRSHYDIIIVTVRLDQLKAAIPPLKKYKSCPSLLFMLNNIQGPDQLQKDFPDKNIILGFPGVGGRLEKGIIKFIPIKQQHTTVGDLNGQISKQTKEIYHILSKSGFKTTLEKNMKSWLKTHAVFISCASAAILQEDGSSIQLGNKRRKIREMIGSIEEGFNALQKTGVQITPKNLKMIFMTLPKWFSVCYWSRAMKGEMGTLAIAPHATIAKQEMQLLAKDVLELIHTTAYKTPTLDKLLLTFIKS